MTFHNINELPAKFCNPTTALDSILPRTIVCISVRDGKMARGHFFENAFGWSVLKE